MNWSVFFMALGVGLGIGALPLFAEGMERADFDRDYRVLYLTVALVVVVAACFGLGAGLA